MGSHNLDEVIRRWSKEELTTEQAIGQILLLLKGFSERLGKLEQRVERGRKGNAPFPAETDPT